VLHRNFKQTWV